MRTATLRDKPNCYTEKHHVIPRCMGGSDNLYNLVALTAREHYVAHLLLVNMFPGELKLSYAATKMTASFKTRNIPRNNRMYAWLRAQHSQNISRTQTGRKYYNNGVKNIKLHPDDVIPEGFVLGRTYSPTKGTTHNRKSPSFVDSKIQTNNAIQRWSKERAVICKSFNVSSIDEVIQIIKDYKLKHGRYWLTSFTNQYPFISRATARSLGKK